MSTAFADPTILLVEPSPMQTKIITQSCKELGMTRLRTLDTGALALQAMREIRPEVVISALYLPDMTGTDLVIAMRADPDLAGIPFILISSETRPQALDPVRQAGVCAIVPKPFTTHQLGHALDATLDYLAVEQGGEVDFRAEDLRVLIVDDSPSARKFMRRLLEHLGIEHFIEAENGKVAAGILGETLVDLVITDYNMPEMDGKALVDFIRTRSWQASVPILMVTSEADMGRLAAVESAGVSGICDKPFEAHVVKDILGRLLVERDKEDNED